MQKLFKLLTTQKKLSTKCKGNKKRMAYSQKPFGRFALSAILAQPKKEKVVTLEEKKRIDR